MVEFFARTTRTSFIDNLFHIDLRIFDIVFHDNHDLFCCFELTGMGNGKVIFESTCLLREKQLGVVEGERLGRSDVVHRARVPVDPAPLQFTLISANLCAYVVPHFLCFPALRVLVLVPLVALGCTLIVGERNVFGGIVFSERIYLTVLIRSNTLASGVPCLGWARSIPIRRECTRR